MADMAFFSFVVVPITGIAGYFSGKSILRLPSYQKGYTAEALIGGCVLGLYCLALYRKSESQNTIRSEERAIISFLVGIFGIGICIGMLVTYTRIKMY